MMNLPRANSEVQSHVQMVGGFLLTQVQIGQQQPGSLDRSTNSKIGVF